MLLNISKSKIKASWASLLKTVTTEYVCMCSGKGQLLSDPLGTPLKRNSG